MYSTDSVLEEVNRVWQGTRGVPEKIAIRDPDTFRAGELSQHWPMWTQVLNNYESKETALKWIKRGVSIREFACCFKGRFKGVFYDSDLPPRKIFENHSSCGAFTEFITHSIIERIKTGAVHVWGRVGDGTPPWLVLPLTVEPQKPRLCLDARFLNLWMRDAPFSLDRLSNVPRFVYPDSNMSKIDDKSGYDHVLLDEDSRQFFGFQWQGWYLVNATLPFGWKISPFVYQTIGMGVTSFFRERGLACALYIDDRLNGEIFTPSGRWSRPPDQRDDEFSFQAATAALHIVVLVLVHLGYFLGVKKCVLRPVKCLTYLGMIVDSSLQSFLIPEDKKMKFEQLRHKILTFKATVPVRDLQRMMGKCISFSLAFPGAKFYIREMSGAIGRAGNAANVVKFSVSLREEIRFWEFLNSWKGHIPWRSERHVALTVSTDASSFRWAAVIHHASGDEEIGDFWEEPAQGEHINVKEFRAVERALACLPQQVRDCRVDLHSDNQTVIDIWMGRGSRSRALNAVAKRLFQLVTSRNIQLSMSYVPSGLNPADWFSRNLSKTESMLAPRCWERVQAEFGGFQGHNLDLMSLDVNSQCDKNGARLRHYTPYPTPGSAAVNVFNQDLSDCDGIRVRAYVFPPFSLISPLLRFIINQRAVVTMVVPKLSPLPSWWPLINALASKAVLLAPVGDDEALLVPTPHGFKVETLRHELWAFRVDRF